MNLRRKASITGIGRTPVKKESERALMDLKMEAGAKAIKDAGMANDDIDAVYTVNPLTYFEGVTAMTAQFLGIHPTFTATAEMMGASPAYAIVEAARAIASGSIETALIISAGKRSEYARTLTGEAVNPEIAEFSDIYGYNGPVSPFAMLARRHMHEYGTTEEQMAKIVVDQRKSASKQPEDRALFREPTSIEEVLGSPIVSSPLHLYQVVYPCDYGIALVVTSPEKAEDLEKEGGQKPIYLLGAGYRAEQEPLSRSEILYNGIRTPVIRTSREAYEMAGLGPEDMDVLGLYDPFPHVAMIELEDSGFCEKGECGIFVEENDLSCEGNLPVNTEGGQLGVGQGGAAGGMVNVVGVVDQLRGKAGKRQVDDAENGLVVAQGGILTCICCLIFGV